MKHSFYTPTLEECLIAVRGQGWLLCLVPMKHRTPEVCAAAISQDPTSIKYSPYTLLELMVLA